MAATCFVALSGDQRIAGYYTLASASVPLTELPPEAIKKLPRYRAVPTVRMGRLAVDQAFKGQGLGWCAAGRCPHTGRPLGDRGLCPGGRRQGRYGRSVLPPSRFHRTARDTIDAVFAVGHCAHQALASTPLAILPLSSLDGVQAQHQRHRMLR
jgi:hypothetical protein